MVTLIALSRMGIYTTSPEFPFGSSKARFEQRFTKYFSRLSYPMPLGWDHYEKSMANQLASKY
jgi:hypothetical protein